MSRIILEKYENGEQKFVVGWDRPLATYYWQHFRKEPEPDPQTGEVDWDKHEDWEEMIAFKGYVPNELPTMQAFWDSCPPKIQDLVTHKVQELLNKHSMDENSGHIIVDLTDKQEA
jgi:hypothetical protein